MKIHPPIPALSINLSRREKFLLLVVPDAESGCWNFTNDRHKSGYGRYAGELAHRVALEMFAGVGIPEGIHVHHICENAACCNPQHLGLVPPATHTRLHALNKTRCRNGHRYDADNTVIHPTRGHRVCLTCSKARIVQRRAASVGHKSGKARESWGSAA